MHIQGKLTHSPTFKTKTNNLGRQFQTRKILETVLKQTRRQLVVGSLSMLMDYSISASSLLSQTNIRYCPQRRLYALGEISQPCLNFITPARNPFHAHRLHSQGDFPAVHKLCSACKDYECLRTRVGNLRLQEQCCEFRIKRMYNKIHFFIQKR